MLAYVAVTRAQDVLDNTGLAWVHAHLDAMGAPAGVAVDRATTPPVAATTPSKEGGRADRPSQQAEPDSHLPASGRRGVARGWPLPVPARVELPDVPSPASGATIGL